MHGKKIQQWSAFHTLTTAKNIRKKVSYKKKGKCIKVHTYIDIIFNFLIIKKICYIFQAIYFIDAQ